MSTFDVKTMQGVAAAIARQGALTEKIDAYKAKISKSGKDRRTRKWLDAAFSDLQEDWEEFVDNHELIVGADPDLLVGRVYVINKDKELETTQNKVDFARAYIFDQLKLLKAPSENRDDREQSGNESESEEKSENVLQNGDAPTVNQFLTGLVSRLKRSERSSGIRMPSIDIAVFNGEMRQFRSFEETFNMIAKRSRDSDIEKLALLRGKLGPNH